MVSAVVFEFGVMRCQPLRRALAEYEKNSSTLHWLCEYILTYYLHDLLNFNY
ncbi:acetyltransferase [Vibrio mimicus]|nr:acetyltransferase [Vibrio mimicus]